MTDARTSSDAVSTEDRILVFSADTHVGPHPRHLRPYCPKQYLDAYDEFVAEWGEKYNDLFEMRAFSEEYWNGRRRNSETEGHYDPQAWLDDMDRDGVAGGVIFHDSLNGQPMPFDLMNSLGNGIPLPEARELAGVGRQMYNTWLADFCASTGGRGLGLAQLPFWDIDASIDELERCADRGLGGVNYPAPGQPGMAQPGHPDLDRFFGACAALDMTLATHIGALPQTEYGDPTGEATFHFGLLDSGEWGVRTVYQLVIFGVFERHPNLKLVLTEVPGVFWNEMCQKMDSLHETPIRRRDQNTARRPSEYAESNVWMGNSFQSRQEAEAAIAIGREDRFLWGSDYPHPEGTFIHSQDPHAYPRTRLSIAHNYHGLPLEKVRKFLGDNAMNAYPRLDRASICRVAAAIGISTAELAIAPILAEHPDVEGTGTLAFRSHGAWS
jgi:predicted TIM-barrel fold metal-dependent hydrolase